MNISKWTMNMRECVCRALMERGQGPTCWSGIWPGGEVTWDYCGDCGEDRCGMGYITPGIAFPYSIFPIADFDPTCRRPIAYQFEIGVVRCMPVMDDDGELPGEEEISLASLGLMHDRHALLCAIRECGGLVAIESWTPAQPAGGCAGGAWSIYVDPSG